MIIAAVPARALTDSEIGTNGTDGNPGTNGGPATASAFSTDQKNTATATGGIGGSGNVTGRQVETAD
jgi:hypothetical protein